MTPRDDAATPDDQEGSRPDDVVLDDAGLSLPLDSVIPDTGGDAGDTDDAGAEQLPPRPITTEDLAALAQVEAELDQRWPETKIDPSLERIELLMDLLGHPERTFPSSTWRGRTARPPWCG